MSNAKIENREWKMTWEKEGIRSDPQIKEQEKKIYS